MQMEAGYLKRTLGSSLAEGLAEVAAKRPSDPIDYLAQWLLKHKQNILRQQQAKDVPRRVLEEITIEEPVQTEAVPTADEETRVVLQVETSSEPTTATEPEQPPEADSEEVQAAATKLTRIEEETTAELDKEKKEKDAKPDSEDT